MDAEAQGNVKKIAEDQMVREDLIVVLGTSNIDETEISVETVRVRDPSYSGPMAGVSLGLPVYPNLRTQS
jgi:glycine/sarcosine/betaine reductase complex component A